MHMPRYLPPLQIIPSSPFFPPSLPLAPHSSLPPSLPSSLPSYQLSHLCLLSSSPLNLPLLVYVKEPPPLVSLPRSSPRNLPSCLISFSCLHFFFPFPCSPNLSPCFSLPFLPSQVSSSSYLLSPSLFPCLPRFLHPAFHFLLFLILICSSTSSSFSRLSLMSFPGCSLYFQSWISSFPTLSVATDFLTVSLFLPLPFCDHPILFNLDSGFFLPLPPKPASFSSCLTFSKSTVLLFTHPFLSSLESRYTGFHSLHPLATYSSTYHLTSLYSLSPQSPPTPQNLFHIILTSPEPQKPFVAAVIVVHLKPVVVCESEATHCEDVDVVVTHP